MKQALQAFREYLDAPHTDYALMINGPWGCGKTYFWREQCAREAKSVSGKNRSRASSYKPLYASLYGCATTSDIDKQLLLSLYPDVRGSKAWGLFGAIGKAAAETAGVKIPSGNPRWFIDAANTVLCFDDLERTLLPIEDVLGYINTFVEHDSIKTVILCNEEAINEESRDNYLRMKEKVVGMTLYYQIDADAVFDAIETDLCEDPEFRKILEEHRSIVLQLFRRSETNNLRSLRRAVSALEAVYRALKRRPLDPKKLSKQLVYAVMPPAFEIHGRNAAADVVRNVYGHPLLSSSWPGNPEYEKHADEFADRYYREPSRVLSDTDSSRCPAICEFLLTGFLDHEAIVTWANYILAPPDAEQKGIDRLFSDPIGMDDDSFRQITHTLLERIENGTVTDWAECTCLFDRLESFSVSGLLQVSPEELLAKYVKGIAAAEQRGEIPTDGSLWWRGDQKVPSAVSPGGEAIRKILRDAETKAEARLAERFVETLVATRNVDPTQFVLDLGFHRGTAILNRLDLQDTVKWISDLSNSDLANLEGALKARYESPEDVHQEELPMLQAIKTEIERLKNEPDSNCRPIRHYTFSRISEQIGQAIVGIKDRTSRGKGLRDSGESAAKSDSE